MKRLSTLDLLMIVATGGILTEEQFNQLYLDNKDVLAVIESREKREFILRKEGKADRIVKARCAAEIEANPTCKGWEIVPATELGPSYYESMAEIHDMRA